MHGKPCKQPLDLLADRRNDRGCIGMAISWRSPLPSSLRLTKNKMVVAGTVDIVHVVGRTKCLPPGIHSGQHWLRGIAIGEFLLQLRHPVAKRIDSRAGFTGRLCSCPKHAAGETALLDSPALFGRMDRMDGSVYIAEAFIFAAIGLFFLFVTPIPFWGWLLCSVPRI